MDDIITPILKVILALICDLNIIFSKESFNCGID